MSSHSPASRILSAVDALNGLDRRKAASLIREELASGAPSGTRWRSIAKLASTIGEISMAVEAARRYAATPPLTLERVLDYYGELARNGRAAEAVRQADALPGAIQANPALLHFRGVIATQLGEFAKAEEYLRRALAVTPLVPQTWFALSVIKKFTPGDPDLARMEAIRHEMKRAPRNMEAQFLYALGKAYDDVGDYGRAFAHYGEGAALMRGGEDFDPVASQAFARQLVLDSTAENLGKLRPSHCDSERAIFITGLPRSGTTLVEQILTSHSAVREGAELNLLQPALIPASDYSLQGAMAYQARAAQFDDPWGELSRDYLNMLEERFGPRGRIVDKTLSHARLMGLLLHMLPKAKVVWLQRDPDDTALSCFRTFFTAKMPWSWSLTDIAAYFRAEDMLHRHWTALYPDRILSVPYEELTADPVPWTKRILAHAGLGEEPQTFEPHKSARSVMTASVAQVRQPISTSRVGAAEAYREFLEPFRAAYRAP